MKKNFLFMFLLFLVNSIFSYSSIKAVNEKELQKVFNKNKEIIVVYRTNTKDGLPKKYIENIIPKEKFNISNDNRIKNTIKYKQKNKLEVLAEIYTHGGSLSSKTEYDFDKKNITMLTYSEGKISSETIAKYKGSIQDENMDIDFYENLSRTYTKMKVKKVENGQEVRTFYPNGKLQSVGIYKDNILNGLYKEYDESGKLIKEVKNDSFIGE